MLKYFRKRNLIVVPSNLIIYALKRKNIVLNPLSSSFYQLYFFLGKHFTLELLKGAALWMVNAQAIY